MEFPLKKVLIEVPYYRKFYMQPGCFSAGKNKTEEQK